jgi:urease accessory protein
MNTDGAAGTPAALLLLADGRFPSGGYAHSGGLEPTVASGRVHDLRTLEDFLIGRARTTGAVAAAFASIACRAVLNADISLLEELEVELDARMPSPAQRATSRQLGRQLLRVLGAIRPDPVLERLGVAPHQPIVLGAGAATLGLRPRDAASAAVHESVAGPAAAAVRLLSLDPFRTHAILARLTATLDQIADDALVASRGAVDALPAMATPLLDVAAETHAVTDRRLFAS